MPRRPDKKAKATKSNVERMINCIMRGGAKSIARKIFYQAMQHVVTHLPKDYEMPGDVQVHQEAGNQQALIHALVDDMIERVRPAVMVKTQRIGGANLQLPRDVPVAEGVSKAIKWIIDAARKRGVGSMSRRLASEFIDILAGRGGAMRKKEEAFKMAMASRMF